MKWLEDHELDASGHTGKGLEVPKLEASYTLFRGLKIRSLTRQELLGRHSNSLIGDVAEARWLLNEAWVRRERE